jgi:uncharacterized protein (TIGR03437 family)
MRRERSILIAKCAVGLGVLPVLVWAYASGPYAHRTGVAGTGEKTCSESGCHIGTAVNGGGGSLTITASGGSTYTPGQKQTITIQITDAAARVYGFQITARLASDRTQQAGTFTSGPSQVVECAPVTVRDEFGDPRPAAGCPASKPLEFVSHTSPFRSGTITVDWTAPAAASGGIEFWVSANAANNNGAADSGDHIYNTFITLQPGTGGGPKPTITEGGVINASGFGGQKGVAPGTWLEIYGANLAASTAEWTGNDFNGATAPNTMGGVSVTIAGKPAFVRFISPGQINVQAPDGIGTGPVPVVVKNGNGSSDPVIVTATDKLPGLLALGNGYVGALQGSTVVGSPGFTGVKPGDTVTLYGIGFGSVTPSIAAGQIAGALNSVTNPLKILFGQSEAIATYRGLGPGFVGLYQFNVTVPNVADGDYPVTVDLGGTGTGQTMKITVKK